MKKWITDPFIQVMRETDPKQMKFGDSTDQATE